MRKERFSIRKFFLSFFLIICLLGMECLAAVVTDNDGGAFITKAEFDSLKNTFQNQLNQFNSQIDNKLNDAITTYLSNVSLGGSGDYPECDIEDYDTIQWRDKLIIPSCTIRTFTSTTSYSDSNNQVWEATYDTIMTAGTGSDAATYGKRIPFIWSIFHPQGYGGVEWIIKGELPETATDGKRYWIAAPTSGDTNTRYRQPSCPGLYYAYDEFNNEETPEDRKNLKRLKGWWEAQGAFTGITSHETDASASPTDGSQYDISNAYGNPDSLKLIRRLAMGTPGRDSNCFGMEAFNSTGSRLGGFRPTKISTEYFPEWLDNTYNRNCGRCDYVTTFPQRYPLVGQSGDESQDYLVNMMCGSENTQEVNYFIASNKLSFWRARWIWPDDCYKTYSAININGRKMSIYQNPAGTWTNAEGEYLNIDKVFKSSMAGVFKFDSFPTSMTISMPTKPHKKLKELETNYFNSDGKQRLKFGDGLPAIIKNYQNNTVTMEFDVAASSGYSTSTYTPYLEISDKSFNENGSRIAVKNGTAISGKPNCYKINIGHNSIQFELRKDQETAWFRFSPGDNTGKNYLKITNIKGKYQGK